ncbi:gene transfer agent family protein [Alsobacter ponti]|uniref:gene transfer agent family protein n=1 Tax=Alsobacter ponti TaxID=2962936 RepID=UPI0027D934FF|nr:GTA-gp10 family protein [Alsobacter ponti]
MSAFPEGRRANPRRGEVEAELGGRRFVLCLTLGALAELEAAFGVDDLSALGRRLARGGLSSRDLLRILGAGARGGGAALTDAEIAALPLGGGLAAWVDAAARLLDATFADDRPEPSPAPPIGSDPDPRGSGVDSGVAASAVRP